MPRFTEMTVGDLVKAKISFTLKSGEASQAIWYFDTERPVDDPDQPYVAVQCHSDRDPNLYEQIEMLDVLFTDQCEYYFVCPDCHDEFRDMQWSGGTKGPLGWREDAEVALIRHQHQKGWCEFCDPAFGNGGWSQ